MIIVFLLTVVFSITCIFFSSPTISLWLNWLYFSFLSSDNKKIISTKYSTVQIWALHYFVCSSWSEDIVCFFFFKKMKNFKCLKVHVLKHEMHNNIVLMISAVGWTLQEKNERKSLTSPHQMMLSTLLTASILSPIGICYSHLQFSLLGDRPSSLFWPGRYTVLCVSSFLENQNLGCLECPYMASFSV